MAEVGTPVGDADGFFGSYIEIAEKKLSDVRKKAICVVLLTSSVLYVEHRAQGGVQYYPPLCSSPGFNQGRWSMICFM